MKSNLWIARVLQGYTQKDVAKLSGIDQGDISRLENKKRRAGKRERKALAAALKKKEKELFPEPRTKED
jgi:transcriptional regulator with XRE-family HTH domain